LKETWFGRQEATKQFLKQRGGTIVNIVSTTGLQGSASLYRKQLAERFAAWHRLTELTQDPSAF